MRTRSLIIFGQILLQHLVTSKLEVDSGVFVCPHAKVMNTKTLPKVLGFFNVWTRTYACSKLCIVFLVSKGNTDDIGIMLFSGKYALQVAAMRAASAT